MKLLLNYERMAAELPRELQGQTDVKENPNPSKEQPFFFFLTPEGISFVF